MTFRADAARERREGCGHSLPRSLSPLESPEPTLIRVRFPAPAPWPEAAHYKIDCLPEAVNRVVRLIVLPEVIESVREDLG